MVSTAQLEGTTLGKYEIRRKLGGGGQAIVYQAWHRDLETNVAIKFLQDHLSQNTGIRERFKPRFCTALQCSNGMATATLQSPRKSNHPTAPKGAPCLTDIPRLPQAKRPLTPSPHKTRRF